MATTVRRKGKRTLKAPAASPKASVLSDTPLPYLLVRQGFPTALLWIKILLHLHLLPSFLFLHQAEGKKYLALQVTRTIKKIYKKTMMLNICEILCMQKSVAEVFHLYHLQSRSFFIRDFIRQCWKNQTTNITFPPLFSNSVTAALALPGLQRGRIKARGGVS